MGAGAGGWWRGDCLRYQVVGEDGWRIVYMLRELSCDIIPSDSGSELGHFVVLGL